MIMSWVLFMLGVGMSFALAVADGDEFRTSHLVTALAMVAILAPAASGVAMLVSHNSWSLCFHWASLIFAVVTILLGMGDIVYFLILQDATRESWEPVIDWNHTIFRHSLGNPLSPTL